MTTDAQTIIGIIDEVKSADGESERGEWRRYDFRIRSPSGTKRYSTFDKGWPTNLKTGKTYRFTYTSKQSGEYTNLTLTSATLVDPSEFGGQPASNGQEPPISEGVPPTTEGAGSKPAPPQPELKAPSRSYDQNQDITRRSIERQIALKAAVELLGQPPPLDKADIPWGVIALANELFAWLRETATDVRSSPTEPPSEPEALETLGVDFAKLNAEQKEKREATRETRRQEEPAESDGGPALFADVKKFANLGAFLTACLNDLGIDKAGVSEILGRPLAQIGNFSEAYEEIYQKQQAEPVENTEA